MAHAAEPPFTHDRTPRIGVLLTNLGTPDAATPSAVRRYLAQFLTDPRVIEIPAWVWKPILYGVILFVRPTQSAKKYAAIWTRHGSPLLVHSVRQRSLLLGYLGSKLKAAGLPADLCPVELGMRYGNPSIGSAIEKLRAAHCEKILVLPLFPQYSASATGSAFDAVADHLVPGAPAAGAALRGDVPRRPRVHQVAGADGERLLEEARPSGQARSVVPRRARGARSSWATRTTAIAR